MCVAWHIVRMYVKFCNLEDCWIWKEVRAGIIRIGSCLDAFGVFGGFFAMGWKLELSGLGNHDGAEGTFVLIHKKGKMQGLASRCSIGRSRKSLRNGLH